MRPATTLDRDNGRDFYHVDCHGQVVADWYAFVHRCVKCRRQWNKDTVARWLDADLGLRFYVKPLQVGEGWVLVEKTAGTNRFIACVPRDVAHRYPKVIL